MKKIIILALILFYGLSLWGQNANRSGFFVELGANKAFNGPLYKYREERPEYEIIDGMRYKVYYRLSGLYNLNMGYRLAFSRHWAFDIAVGAQSDLIVSPPKLYALVKFIPGFRYTSSEVFANMSLYADVHTHVGWVLNNDFDVEWSDLAYGYDVGVGLNFTQAFYGGFIWDAQVYSRHYWGGLGIKLGYRF